MKLILKTKEVKPVEAQPAKYTIELDQDEIDFIRDILGSTGYSDYDQTHHYFTKAQYSALHKGLSETLERWDVRYK